MPVEGGYLYDFTIRVRKMVGWRRRYEVAFNIMLAHAKAVTAYRELALAGEIGGAQPDPELYLNDDADKKPPQVCRPVFNRSF